MKLKQLLLAGASVMLLGIAPATAAPSVGIDLKTEATESTPVDQVHYRYRRCWRHHGYLHCRTARRYYRSYAYGPYYGPSIGLYFGGGGRHWGGHRGHWGGRWR